MKLKVIAIGAWLLFTISLSLWWLYFGLSQLDLLKAVEGYEKVVSQQRMLIWEGASLVVSIIIGGAALCYLAYQEFRERRRIQDFFSVFSHELKTPLASIQLQAESLGAENLIESTQRLLVHLDNAMFIARLPTDLFLEEVALPKYIKEIAGRWSSLTIDVKGDAVLEIDKRLLEAIFQNLFSNSVVHGRSSRVELEILDLKDSVKINFKDNGIGFKGDYNNLGKKFYRLNNRSGSGLGLYIVKQLLKKLSGEISFKDQGNGFFAEITLGKSLNS